MKKVINKVLSIFLFCGIVFTSCELGLGKAVDMEAPEITIISPESYASTPKDILIKGYASDNESIKLLTISIEELGLKYQWDGSWKKYKGSDLIPLNESEVISNGDKKKLEWNITLNIENAVSGTQYTLYSQVEDEYGNTSSKSKDERSFTCDIEKPVVSVNIPELLKNYITPEESKNQYKLQDSKDVLKLINKSFVIEGTQKEDTKLGELYILLDTSSSPNVKSYEQEKDLNKITEEGKLICIKKIEGNRSWNTTVSESDMEQLSERTVIRIVTESHDAAGNVDRRVQGWFIYDNEADTPWIEASFGGEKYENATSNAVYPNCALQGQCYDDDGLKEITITTYIETSENTWQEGKISKIDETILAKENYPTYYAWSINAISNKKTFKVEIECVDINGEKSEKVTRFLSVADVNPPKVEITPITNELGDKDGNITISGTVSDDAPLSKNLKMVRIKNNDSPLDYYDSTYEGWTKENEVFEIQLNNKTENNGECKYSFSRTFNLFTDFGVSSTEIYNSMMLIFNMEDEKSASIVSLNLQGDTQPPVLEITKIQIENSTQEYEISGDEWTILPPASSNYKIQLVGTWSDNSANYWNLDNGKKRIGELIVKKDSNEKFVTPTINNDGTWQSGYFSPGNSASSVYVSLKDFGGNTTEKKVSRAIKNLTKAEKDLIELHYNDIKGKLDIHGRLKLIRLSHELLQNTENEELDFYQKVYTSYDSYRKYEKDRIPSRDTLMSIAKNTNTSLDYIFGLKTKSNLRYDLAYDDISLFTGLDIGVIDTIRRECNSNHLYCIVINYLFRHHVISDFINLVMDILQYNNIYTYLDNSDNKNILNSIDKLAEYIKWQKVQFINNNLLKVTKDLAKIISYESEDEEDYKEKLSDKQKQQYDNAQEIINEITKQLNLFSRYEDEEETI